MVCVAGRFSTTFIGLLVLALALSACGRDDGAGGVAAPGTAVAQAPATADECSRAMAVEAWQGTISYSHARDIEGSNPDHVVYSVNVDVNARLEENYRNESVAGFLATTMGGTIAHSSEEHTHDTDEHRVDMVMSGEGPPIEASRMTLNVMADCRYDFYFIGNVFVTGTAGDEPIEGPKGVNPIRGAFEGSGLELSGTFDFPVYGPDEIEASVDKPIWFAERYDVAGMSGEEGLGTVRVNWRFVPGE
ncbi:MAG: hypothetical protein WD273_05575 [Trueperaceae bacterium]